MIGGAYAYVICMYWYLVCKIFFRFLCRS